MMAGKTAFLTVLESGIGILGCSFLILHYICLKGEVLLSDDSPVEHLHGCRDIQELSQSVCVAGIALTLLEGFLCQGTIGPVKICSSTTSTINGWPCGIVCCGFCQRNLQFVVGLAGWLLLWTFGSVHSVVLPVCTIVVALSLWKAVQFAPEEVEVDVDQNLDSSEAVSSAGASRSSYKLNLDDMDVSIIPQKVFRRHSAPVKMSKTLQSDGPCEPLTRKENDGLLFRLGDDGRIFSQDLQHEQGLATIREQSASPVDKNAKNARRSSVQVMADAFKKLVSRADVKTQTDVSDMPQEGSDGGLVNSEKTSLLAFAWSVLRAISIALVVGMFFHLMFEGLNVGSRFVRSSVYIEDEGYLDDDEFAIE